MATIFAGSADRGSARTPALYVFGAAAVLAGAFNLIWGDFATDWQPIQAFGDHVPGRALLAYFTALWLIVAGLALFGRRTRRAGAIGLAIVYGIFAVFWLPRFYWVLHLIGFKLSPIIGVFDGLGQQVALVAAAAIAYASMMAGAREGDAVLLRVARIAFGLCALIFGVAHFTGTSQVASLVPHWMPLGGAFWAIVTGVGFALSGIAIATGWFGIFGARLLALMLAVFSAFVWLPMLFRFPHAHAAWGGNAYNLAIVAAAWIVAERIGNRQGRRNVFPV
jgi:uncharacterized membrane protein